MKSTIDALEAYGVDEAAEIIKSLIDNINQRGMYSKESTVGFLEQAFFCLKPANQSKTAALAQARAEQAEPVEMSPEFTDTARAALLWVLWHHQGGSSKVGQPIRFALGMGQHEYLNEHQIAEAKRWASLARPNTPPAAPVPKLEPLADEEIEQMLNENFGYSDMHAFARAIEAAHNAKMQARAGVAP